MSWCWKPRLMVGPTRSSLIISAISQKPRGGSVCGWLDPSRFFGGETMSKATYPLKLPASIKAAAARLAKEDGVSLNEWITAAVAQKIGAVETAADFIKRRAGIAKPEDLKGFLANAPDVPPEPGDEIPVHLRTTLRRA